MARTDRSCPLAEAEPLEQHHQRGSQLRGKRTNIELRCHGDYAVDSPDGERERDRVIRSGLSVWLMGKDDGEGKLR